MATEKAATATKKSPAKTVKVSLVETATKMRDNLNTVIEELDKLENKGNRAAGGRARKELQIVKTGATMLRKSIQEKVNSDKAAK